QLGRDRGHVLALVAVLRHLLAAATGAQRRAEQIDLAARVVEVVLALDLVAGEREQPRQRVAVGGVACTANGHGAGRVAAHELDLETLRTCGRTGAEAHALVQHALHDVAVPARLQPQVDEPRPGDLGALDPGRLQLLHDPLGDLARRRLHRLGQPQRHRARVVAVRGVGRAVEPHRLAVAAGRADRGPQGLGQLAEDATAHGTIVVGWRDGRRPRRTAPEH